ncbi:peptidase C39 [Lamprobacter modestohalophilus]|uniref:Peptidase C39 n=1 Tax=Lamprobacter modestohalophilus TaxID=1064514 RepID=A0A9X0W6Q0_9GAMM|nr:peptidase C39 [Lamprobacter modestohalophilus]
MPSEHQWPNINVRCLIAANALASLCFIASFILGSNLAQASQSRVVTSLLELRQQNVAAQEWDLSCGAAALTTVLNHQHDDPVSEREVAIGLMGRQEYVDNPLLVQAREGFSLLDLKRFVESRGYQGIGLGQLELDGLVQRAPVIVPIKTKGYNHFVIFRGVAGNRVLLADPAWGNRTMRRSRFLDAWIDYPKLGHIGFIVALASGEQAEPYRLAPRESEFLFLR